MRYYACSRDNDTMFAVIGGCAPIRLYDYYSRVYLGYGDTVRTSDRIARTYKFVERNARRETRFPNASNLYLQISFSSRPLLSSGNETLRYIFRSIDEKKVCHRSTLISRPIPRLGNGVFVNLSTAQDRPFYRTNREL